MPCEVCGGLGDSSLVASVRHTRPLSSDDALQGAAVQARLLGDGRGSEVSNGFDGEPPAVVAGAVVGAVVVRVGDFPGKAFKELVSLFPREGLESGRRLDRSALEGADGVSR